MFLVEEVQGPIQWSNHFISGTGSGLRN